jgi:hypothetical protein
MRFFRPLVIFSSNNSPATRAKAFFEYGFAFAKKIDYEIANFSHSGVNENAVTKNEHYY